MLWEVASDANFSVLLAVLGRPREVTQLLFAMPRWTKNNFRGAIFALHNFQKRFAHAYESDFAYCVRYRCNITTRTHYILTD